MTVFLFFQPLMAFAQGQEEKKPPEWVMSYFMLLLFLGLAILILLRPGNRQDSVKTQDEIDAEIIEKSRRKPAGH